MAAFERLADEGHLTAVWNNGDLVGHAGWGKGHLGTQIFHIFVRNDARVLYHANALVDTIEAETPHSIRTWCWCADDLPANLFWGALGFHNISWRHSPRKTSKRKHLLWARLRPTAVQLAHLYVSGKTFNP